MELRKLKSSNHEQQNTDQVPSAERSYSVAEIQLDDDFSLSAAICSNGFSRLEPNNWTPPPEDQGDDDLGEFERQIRCEGHMMAEDSCRVRLRQERRKGKASNHKDQLLRIDIEPSLTLPSTLEVIRQVTRMCRLARPTSSETPNHSSPASQSASSGGLVRLFDVCSNQWMALDDEQLEFAWHPSRSFRIAEWFAACPAAKSRKFGRVFRSPTIWEDLIRAFLVCNVNWSRTRTMSAALCRLISSVPGAFPTPLDVSRFSEAELQQLCGLGYRANWISLLARQVCDGDMDLQTLEDVNLSVEEARKRLMRIKGVGPYCCNLLLQALGFHDVLPMDSETEKFMKTRGFVSAKASRKESFQAAERRYAPYSPFRYLAFWFEMWRGYEEAHDNRRAARWRAAENPFVVDHRRHRPADGIQR